MPKSGALKKITDRAKHIRRQHPGKSWKAAIKEAGRDYREGKIGARPRTRARKAKRKKSYRKGQVVKVKHILAGIGSVEHHKSQYKKSLQHKIMQAAGRRELAIKKNQRKKISREIAKLRRDYRLMC